MTKQQGGPGSRKPGPVRVRVAIVAAAILAVLAPASIEAARRPGSNDPSRTGPSGLETQPSGSDTIARGKYLTDAGDCVACHTKPGGEPFAGGLYLKTPFGQLSTPNITPDNETGIGTWTGDQFYRVLHAGIGKGGEYLYPAMPFPWYTKVTRDDAMAIRTYLASVKPVHAPREPNRMTFPFNIRIGLLAWNEAFFHEGTFKPDPKQSAEINRGAYLVEGLGHCGECHNGHAMLGAGTAAEPLRGGEIQGWYAPNLTSDVREGIGKYSGDQLVAYLKTGQAPGMGAVAGPMAQTIHDSLSKLNDADLHAIAAYLKSTPPEASYSATQRSAYTGPQPEGRDVYLNNCVSCHQRDGRGLKGSIASLAGNGTVLAGGPQDVIRVVLGGLPAKGTDAPMPAAGEGMTDRQVADVVNYVRQAWGNTAPPNAGGGMVADLRGRTPATFFGQTSGPCPPPAPADVAAAVSDPKLDIANRLHAITEGNILQIAEQAVTTLKAAVPHASQADIVNGLAAAYCPIVRQDTTLSGRQKVERLDEFSERVYSELVSNGKE